MSVIKVATCPECEKQEWYFCGGYMECVRCGWQYEFHPALNARSITREINRLFYEQQNKEAP